MGENKVASGLVKMIGTGSAKVKGAMSGCLQDA